MARQCDATLPVGDELLRCELCVRADGSHIRPQYSGHHQNGMICWAGSWDHDNPGTAYWDSGRLSMLGSGETHL